MSELEPFAKIRAEEGEFEMRRDNTSLFRHLGNYALYDHVFVVVGEDAGIYIWRTHPNYDEVSTLAVENECALHLNIPEVADCDRRTYEKHNTADLGDFIPEGWE